MHGTLLTVCPHNTLLTQKGEDPLSTVTNRLSCVSLMRIIFLPQIAWTNCYRFASWSPKSPCDVIITCIVIYLLSCVCFVFLP